MKQAAFWVAVAGVAIVAQPLFRVAAESKYAPQGLRDLYSFTASKNG